MEPNLWGLLEGAEEDEVAVVVRFAPGVPVPSLLRVVTRFGDIATGRVRRGDVVPLRTASGILSVKAPLRVSPKATRRPRGRSAPARPPRTSEEVTGRGVVAGVIDWGCDFTHPNFLDDDGRTRLLAIWDQRPSPSPAPEPYGYGRVLTNHAINRALESSDPFDALDYDPADADLSGKGTHGTHVLDIAAGVPRAGPGGVAPGARLVFVHMAMHDRGPRNLGNSVTLLEAVDFIFRTAGERPCVINMSLGTQCGPHDGSSLTELGIDAALAGTRGRAIVQSCGNYFERQIHSAGVVRAGERSKILWLIDRRDTTVNEFDLWYAGGDRFVVRLYSPDGRPVVVAAPDTHGLIEVGGKRLGRFGHRTGDPNNHDNQLTFVLSPEVFGRWVVEIEGVEARSGTYDAWIEKDDSSRWSQSTLRPATHRGTTNSICNGRLSIAVGAYDEESMELTPFSSEGPTRDGRNKPEILAPGGMILAARSSPADGSNSLLTRKSGTSMASPCVAGAVALLFEAGRGKLCVGDVREILRRTAQPLPGNGRSQAAWGILDIDAAVELALRYRPAKSPRRATGPAWTANPAAVFDSVYRPARSFQPLEQAQVIGQPGAVGPLYAETGDVLITRAWAEGDIASCRCLVEPEILPRLPSNSLLIRPHPSPPAVYANPGEALAEEDSAACQSRLRPALLTDPPFATPRVARTGLTVVLGATYKFTSADRSAEVTSIMLASLMGEHYKPPEAAAVACDQELNAENIPPEIDSIRVFDDLKSDQMPPVKLVSALRDRGLLRAEIDDATQRRLEHAWALEYAWRHSDELEFLWWKEHWLTDKSIFQNFCWQQGALLEVLRSRLFPQPAVATDVKEAVKKLWQSLDPGANLLLLLARQKRLGGAPGYKHLFPTDPAKASDARQRFLYVCAGRFNEIANLALRDPSARLEGLLERFDEDYRAYNELRQKVAGSKGEDLVRFTLADCNAPPFPSVIRTNLDDSRSAENKLSVPTGAKVFCAMKVEFDDVFSAFGAQYFWDVLRVTQGASGQEEVEETTYARKWTVYKSKISRQIDYTSEDFGRTRDFQLTSNLGALRVIGTSISGLISGVLQDPSEREVVLKEAGAFRIRCIESRPGPASRGAVLRAPSIAYVDCEVVDGEKLSERSAMLTMLSGAEAWQDVEELLHRQSQSLQSSLSAKPDTGLALEPAAQERAKKRIEQIKKILERRTANFKEEAPGATPFRFIASLVMDDNPPFEMIVEAAETGRGADGVSVLVVDSSVADGRYAKATQPTKTDAVAEALKSILEDANTKYGRGYCTVIVAVFEGDVDWEKRSFRVGKKPKALVMELIEGASLLISVIAIVAAPLTGGASMVLLVPAGLIGIVPAAYRLSDRYSQGTLRWNLETALDIVDVVSGFLGVAKAAASGLKFAKLAKGFQLVDRAMGATGIILGNEQFFRQLEEISKQDMLPGEKRFALAMAIGNKLLSDGILAGSHLISHANEWIAKSKSDPVELVLKNAKAADPAGDIVASRNNLKPTRPADRARIGIPDSVHVDLDLSAKARKFAGRDVLVVREKGLGDGAEVRYSLDRFGFINDVYVAMGEHAGDVVLKSHARVAAKIRGYSTVVGKLRTLFLRALALIAGNPDWDVGRTAGWEAAVEIKKLREQMNDYVAATIKGDPNLTPAFWDEYLAGLARQIDEHESRLRSHEQATGVVAARKVITQPPSAQQSLTAAAYKLIPKSKSITVEFAPESQKHVSVEKVRTGEYHIRVPKDAQGVGAMMPEMEKAIGRHIELEMKKKNRTGAEEAEFRGYPEAEPGYQWVKQSDGRPPIYNGEPPREYSQSRGTFVDKLKLLDSEDRVTPDGIEWLRNSIPGFEHKSTDEIRMESERGTILEKLFWAEYGDEFRRRRTNTNLVFMPEGTTGKRDVPNISKVVNAIGQQVPLQEGARDALKRNTGAFIAADEGVLKPLGEVLQNHPDASVRKWFEDFTNGIVGAKEPDCVEFDVPNRIGFVLDVTQRYGDPIHNFKTLFYLRVFELLIPQSEFRGADYRSPRRQRPIGPPRATPAGAGR